jgi:hypothetical protein
MKKYFLLFAFSLCLMPVFAQTAYTETRTLRWAASPDAARYGLEIQRAAGNVTSGAVNADADSYLPFSQERVRATSFSGVYPEGRYRFRVTVYDDLGLQSSPTSWSYFAVVRPVPTTPPQVIAAPQPPPRPAVVPAPVDSDALPLPAAEAPAPAAPARSDIDALIAAIKEALPQLGTAPKTDDAASAPVRAQMEASRRAVTDSRVIHFEIAFDYTPSFPLYGWLHSFLGTSIYPGGAAFRAALLARLTDVAAPVRVEAGFELTPNWLRMGFTRNGIDFNGNMFGFEGKGLVRVSWSRIAGTFRLGGGAVLFQNFRFKEWAGQGTTIPDLPWYACAGAGLSFEVFPVNWFFLSIGADFRHEFTPDKPQLGYIILHAGFGLRF